MPHNVKRPNGPGQLERIRYSRRMGAYTLPQVYKNHTASCYIADKDKLFCIQSPITIPFGAFGPFGRIWRIEYRQI